ncbi:MAG: UDP-N-acetylmuramoyl-L-alanyl-D-glutamate--2,6-diaminopimelate ligase [Woeseiaceae bacterium]|nr:UDP-N-acetylmuramoyl-L-alanyl-D-glutamate--2,6-diaminopimelate ligase [Woeseiaceae bacterium]
MSMPAEYLSTKPTLADLLQGIAVAPAIEVRDISSDSRDLKPGDLFLACGGENSHGLDYAADAVTAGVAAIAWDSSTAEAPAGRVGVPMIAVEDLAGRLGEIANRFYARPSEAVKVLGVTGTNGKTTVAWLVAQCCEHLGETCGYVGTLGTGVGEVAGGEGMTTPGAIELHRHLAGFRDAAAGWAAVEVSSHALAQDRIAGVSFDTVMFTNLSRDHLDYHGSMQKYFETKARLFLDYPAKHRIINLDSEFGDELAARCGQDVVTVSTRFDRVANGRPYVFVRSVVAKGTGSNVRIASSWGTGEFHLPLPGDFNVANAVMVLAAMLVHGVPLQQACEKLEMVSAPPGRLERVPAPEGLPSVYIDYAHSPEALDAVLRALRAHCAGRLWCVFGCGGDRDAGKRPQMGRMAEKRADVVVITNDNPRSESPRAIIDGVLEGIAAPDKATVIEDRAAAIAWAIDNAQPGDTILVAGKGHEDYQLIGAERIDFSDYGAALANLDRRAGEVS